jgi:hypothetical protein
MAYYSLLCPLLIVLVLPACDQRRSGPMSDSTFVEVMVDLNKLRDTLGGRPDSAAIERVLREHRTSASSVEEMAGIVAADADRSSALWHAIERKSADFRRPRPEPPAP